MQIIYSNSQFLAQQFQKKKVILLNIKASNGVLPSDPFYLGGGFYLLQMRLQEQETVARQQIQVEEKERMTYGGVDKDGYNGQNGEIKGIENLNEYYTIEKCTSIEFLIFWNLRKERFQFLQRRQILIAWYSWEKSDLE